MMNRKAMLVKVTALLVLIICIVASFMWLLSNGRILLALPEGSKLVSIVSEDVNISESIDADSYGKTIPSGSYVITVSKDDTSYAAMVKVGRFLTQTKVDATSLTAQSGRSFVGDEPRSCVVPVETAVVSYNCNGRLNTLVSHQPATDTTPTITRYVPTTNNNENEHESADTGDEVIEGTVYIDGAPHIVAKATTRNSTTHKIFKLVITSSGWVGKEYKGDVPKMGNGGNYIIRRDSSGLSAINDSTLLTGDSFQSLNSIEVPKEVFKPFASATSVDVSGARVVLVEQNRAGSGERTVTSPGSIITFYEKKRKTRKTDWTVTTIRVCGNYVCALDDKGLLRLLDSNLKEKYTFVGVNNFDIDGDYLLTVTSNRLYRIDLHSMTGHIAYSSDYFHTTGVASYEDTTILTVRSEDKNHVLMLNSSTEYSDRRVETLLKNTFVKTVSIYEKQVFISPELGDMTYDNELGSFEYRKDVREAARKSVEESISGSGLREAGYTIHASF